MSFVCARARERVHPSLSPLFLSLRDSTTRDSINSLLLLDTRSALRRFATSLSHVLLLLLSLLSRCSLTVVFSIEVLCPFPCLLSLVHEPSAQFENTGADCLCEFEERIARVRSVIVEIWWCFVLSRCPNSDLAKPKSWFLGVVLLPL
jgi:hypothetical protein